MKKIFKAINEVMKEVTYIQKDAQVTGGGQNYSAVTHDQVVSMVRASMVKHGIVCFPEQIKGEILVYRDLAKEIKMHLYQGEYKIHFCSVEDDSFITVIVQAHANDNGDKAPGKALTYAVKSAMLKVFNLETGVNDESREEIRESLKGITKEHIEELRALIKETESDEAKFCEAMKIQSIESMFDANFSAAKGVLEKKKKKMTEAQNGNNP